MEISKDFAEANGINEDQLTAINGHLGTEIIPDLKKEYEGLANKNAEGILSGASDYAKGLFKVEVDREQGEKYGDYLKRISDLSSASASQALADKQLELDEKLKNFKGGEEYKQQLDKLISEKDELLRQVAELEPLKGLDVTLDEKNQELVGLKKEVAYNSVKPNFPDTVNKFEADAMWNAFKGKIEEKYNLEIIDGKPFAIDKENVHKKYELAVLLSQDEDITKLLEGREQNGVGKHKPADLKDVEGVPFKVPSNATSEEISKLVREHVLKELGSLTHVDFANKFEELYSKIKNA